MKISDKIANEVLVLTAQKYFVQKYFVFFLNILCLQWCKPDVSKSVITEMRFTTEDKHLIKWMWRNDIEKHLLKMKMNSWLGKDTDQNISARCLTLLIFAVSK